jgi:addiction module HigA family antidote
MKKKFIQKNAPHPGVILYEFWMKPLNLTVSEMAGKLSIARPNLSAIINGRAGVSAVMALKLSRAFKTSPELWMNLQANYELSQTLKGKKPFKHVKSLVSGQSPIPR